MRTDGKVLLVNLAAFEEHGKKPIDYPVEHALIFFVSERGFKFPAYNFAPMTWPDYGSGLLSRQLERDIDTLVTRGVLEMTRSPCVLITDAGVKEAQELVQALQEEGESYQLLRDAVSEALKSDWHIFLEKCYMMYIRKEYSLAKR